MPPPKDGWDTIESAWKDATRADSATDVAEAEAAVAAEADADADTDQEDRVAGDLRRRRAFLVEIPHEDAVWTDILQGDPRIALRHYLLATNGLPAAAADVHGASSLRD